MDKTKKTELTTIRDKSRKEAGARIKKRRKELGKTQKWLARKIHRAEVTVQQYESGIRFPDLATQMYIADALECKHEDLFKGVGIAVEDLLAVTRATVDAIDSDYDANNHEGLTPDGEISISCAVDTSELTYSEIHELQIYRDFLIFRRGQSAESSPDNNPDT